MAVSCRYTSVLSSCQMRKMGVATAGICAIAVLSACSTGADKASTIPTSTAASPSPVTSADNSPTATPSTTAPVGETQTFKIQRESVPAGLTGEATAAAGAWLAYWEYLGVANSIPAIDPPALGKVMTGTAATKAYAYDAKLRRMKTHVIGTVGVDIARVSVHGSTRHSAADSA
jgi:hypothetical protein